MIDLHSVSIKGAFNVDRARLLWQDGTAKVFGIKGFLLQVDSEPPTKLKGYLARWNMQTARGQIEIKRKCIGCGGRQWWRTMRVNSDNLWRSA